MPSLIRTFSDIDRSLLPEVGGKGAGLGELARIDGVRVPPGFVVTTAAHDRGMDDEVAAEIGAAVAALGPGPFAVRSSATAEDLPTSSFAGQHDSHLDVAATDVVDRVQRCWGSLFTDRAVSYRAQHGIDDADVRMAVVVQVMVDADVSGVMFTADPVNGDRTVTAVEAVPGLGEALVSGLVDADSYRVRDGEVVDTSTALGDAVLSEERVLELERLGRSIEAHLGSPQDVEWCLDGRGFHVVQSRPITTLFPVPEAPDDDLHVYLSVGHQQMMTDPMTPLGLSVWLLTAARDMDVAGGRLFVDVTPILSSPAVRDGFVAGFTQSDPLSGDALRAVVEREGFLPVASPNDDVRPPRGTPPADGPAPIDADPALVAALIEEREASIIALRREIAGLAGADLIDFVVDDIAHMKTIVFEPRSQQVVMGGMEAAWWLNDHVQEWLGETNVADTLSQSVPHNVTSEMGLALLDVADAIRPHPGVVAALEVAADDGFLDGLPALDGGQQAHDAIVAFLDRYGMRCVGEIDVARPRWAERPTTLLPLLLGNVRNAEPGAGERRFEQGRQEADAKAADVLARLRALPDGEAKADEASTMIDRVRTFAGYREYPKYVIVNRYFAYKQALDAEAGRLVDAGVLRTVDDAHFVSLQELRDVVVSGTADLDLIDERRRDLAAFASLTPPRVLASTGEVIAGSYRRDDLPEGALAGLPVSAGIVEGRARVIHDLGEAEVEPGDILVTAFTDPSWSPLFVAVSGLVTEVGGQMTHGAVIAREYGLPAVVGVEGATHLITDGQHIRVNGTNGFVELL